MVASIGSVKEQEIRSSAGVGYLYFSNGNMGYFLPETMLNRNN